jgi:DNA replication licensing factor MCM6
MSDDEGYGDDQIPAQSNRPKTQNRAIGQYVQVNFEDFLEQ